MNNLNDVLRLSNLIFINSVWMNGYISCCNIVFLKGNYLLGTVVFNG